MNYQLKRCLLPPTACAIFCAHFLLVTPGTCAAVAAANGVVRDDKGIPLAGVTVQLCGLEALHDGNWKCELRLGVMSKYQTDQNGRFEIPFSDPNLRFDVYFDKDGLAPVFLYAISNSTPELNIRMTRGQTVSGTVTKSVNGKAQPTKGVIVELQLPYVDLWYQRSTKTDASGKYFFQVSPPPSGRKWQVMCNKKVLQIDIKQGEPLGGHNFEIGEIRVGRQGVHAQMQQAILANESNLWVERCLKDFDSIKTGLTRSEVEKKFRFDGGLQGVSPGRFCHPECPYFKIDVECEFKRDATDEGRAIAAQTDKVLRVSKPYIERPFAD